VKKLMICLLIVLVVLGGLGIYQYKVKHSGLNSHIATGFTATELIENEQGAFLNVIFDDERKTEKELVIRDQELINELQSSDIDEIIGGQIIFSLPESVIKKHHLDKKSINAQYLLLTSEYDEYFELVGISYK